MSSADVSWVGRLQIRPQCNGRGGGIRTRDPLLPKQMRYQAALRPDYLFSLIYSVNPFLRVSDLSGYGEYRQEGRADHRRLQRYWT